MQFLSSDQIILPKIENLTSAHKKSALKESSGYIAVAGYHLLRPALLSQLQWTKLGHTGIRVALIWRLNWQNSH